jgi:hypothetical protein
MPNANIRRSLQLQKANAKTATDTLKIRGRLYWPRLRRREMSHARYDASDGDIVRFID